MTSEDSDEHKERMERRKEGFERRKAAATLEKGLILVNTGNGKGKTTASLGLAFRALGQGMKVGIIQFIKGAIATGEAAPGAQAARSAHRNAHHGRRLHLEHAGSAARHRQDAPRACRTKRSRCSAIHRSPWSFSMS